ncbi:hypothetical protein APICC_02077 [Apis cerana cerana]|uniref:Uncharacterized protein n=1 Tax=Apis cerana cerana TaxID=94128 RepID=A0A2A3EKA7_APICC|nr:hypothetical protein APICC_02077 [Apis cerana cerana]
MSELHHDEIKGPPSTQTDFVNFLAVISGNYNYEITISFAPETRKNIGRIDNGDPFSMEGKNIKMKLGTRRDRVLCTPCRMPNNCRTAETACADASTKLRNSFRIYGNSKRQLFLSALNSASHNGCLDSMLSLEFERNSGRQGITCIDGDTRDRYILQSAEHILDSGSIGYWARIFENMRMREESKD